MLVNGVTQEVVMRVSLATSVSSLWLRVPFSPCLLQLHSYPSIISLTLTWRLTTAETSKPLWIQVCSVIRGGKCWLVKKLTWDNQESNELWITHLNMWHRWRIRRAGCMQRGSLGEVSVELPSEGSTARSTLHTEAHWVDGDLDKLGASCDGSSSGFYHRFYQISGLGQLMWLSHGINQLKKTQTSPIYLLPKQCFWKLTALVQLIWLSQEIS